MAARKKKIEKRKISKKEIRKKRKVSKKELTRRAKKGWETRRKLYGSKGRKPVIAKPKKPVTTASKKEEELRKRVEQLEQRNELLESLSQLIDDSDWTRRDGTLAINYSSIRFLGDATEIILNTLTKSYFVDGSREKGIQKDLSLWYDQAEFFAEKLDVDVREVYTLFFSP